MDDKSLVESARRGDRGAFETLVKRYEAKVYHLAYGFVQDPATADDLAQDVFVKVYCHLAKFKFESEFGTWLYRIAVNSTLTHLRKNRLRTFFSFEKINEDDKVSAEVIAALTDDTGADQETFARELQEKLNEAMQKLSIKHRTVITLFEIDGLGHQEIAEIMNCSVGTVRSRLHYAKQLLQAELQPYIRR